MMLLFPKRHLVGESSTTKRPRTIHDNFVSEKTVRLNEISNHDLTIDYKKRLGAGRFGIS